MHMCLCLLSFSIFIAISSGSTISFTSSPTTITPWISRSLTLLCGVKDTASTPDVPVVGRRDVTHSDDDMKNLTSVVITRHKDDDVASVTPFEPAKTYGNDANLNVTDDVYGDFGGQGWISLTWSAPTRDQAATYVCQVSGVTETGHNVVLTSSLDVSVSEPTTEDLAKRIFDLETEIITLKNEKQEMASMLNTTIDEITTLNHKTDDIATLLTNMRHVETGSVSSEGYSDTGSGWHESQNDNGVYKIQEKTVHFKTPYQTPPVVFLSVVDFRQWQHSTLYSAFYSVTLANVSEHSLTVQFKTRNVVGNQVLKITANWISMSR